MSKLSTSTMAVPHMLMVGTLAEDTFHSRADAKNEDHVVS